MFTAEKAREMASVSIPRQFHWVMGEIEKASKLGQYEVTLESLFFADRERVATKAYADVVGDLEKLGYKVKFVEGKKGFNHTHVSWAEDAS